MMLENGYQTVKVSITIEHIDVETAEDILRRLHNVEGRFTGLGDKKVTVLPTNAETVLIDRPEIPAVLRTPLETVAQPDPTALFGAIAPQTEPHPVTEQEVTTLAQPAGISPIVVAQAQQFAQHVATPKEVELDSAGFPWDARIHAQNKAKKADGTWKAARGVDKNLVDLVEAEYRGVAVDVPEELAHHVGGQITPHGISHHVSGNVEPVIQTSVTAAPQTSSANLMSVISQLSASKSIDLVYIKSLCERMSVAFNKTITAIAHIMGDKALEDYALGLLRADGKIQ